MIRSFYLNIFQIFGISSNFPECSKTQKLILFFCRIFNLSILSAIILVTVVYQEHIFFSKNIIGKFTDVIQLQSPIISHMVAILESLWTQKAQNDIWNKIILSKNCMKGFQSVSIQKDKKKYFRKFCFLLIAGLLSEISILILVRNNVVYSRLFYCKLFSETIGRLANLQKILYIDLICNRLHNLNEELEYISNLSQISFNKRCDLKIHEKLKKIKKCHSIFWEMSQSINERFGFSMLFSITNYFICLTVDLYWIIFHFGRVCKFILVLSDMCNET